MSVEDLTAKADAIATQVNDRTNRLIKAGKPEEAIKAMTLAQKELRVVKRQASDEEREARAQFSATRTDIGGQGALLGLVANSKGRRMMAASRASQRRGVARTQQDVILPYQRLKSSIDAAIAQIDGFKFDVVNGDLEDDDDEVVEETLSPSLSGVRPAQWLPDPLGRHELRYWDGDHWTAHVSDAGVQGHNPV